MKNKLLILSVVAFLAVIIPVAVGIDYTIGDHPYYTTTGQFGQGHDLALIVARPLYLLFGDLAIPVFFNFFFAFSVYFLIKPFVKTPEWAILLAPITPLTTVYAQIFAISLFNFMLGFYFRLKLRENIRNTPAQMRKPHKRRLIGKFAYKGYLKELPIFGFLILVFLAHYWTGLFVAGIFALYVLAFDRKSLRESLLPTILIAGIFFFFISQPIGFLTQAPGTGTYLSMIFFIPFLNIYLGLLGFFLLLTRGLSLFFLSFPGLYLLYKRHRDFFKVNLLLFFIPLIAFAPFASDYWNWRLFYFMPFLALTSVLLSYLFEGKSDQSRKEL
ncbi:hypothetical protein ES703_09854 [subsurface metagenome]